MNKTDPNAIVDDFVTTSNASLDEWRLIVAALEGQRIALRRRSAADAFMGLAVAWESFLSRRMIGAINRDATQTVATLEGRVRRFATEELRIPEGHLPVALVVDPHLNVSEVRRLLDPDDYNVVARSRAELAERWLAEPYKSRATGITNFQFKPVLIVRLIRNALAHRSTAAIAEANRVARLGSTPAPLRHTGPRDLDVAGWRRYLLTTHRGSPRVENLYNNLTALASTLKVP